MLNLVVCKVIERLQNLRMSGGIGPFVRTPSWYQRDNYTFTFIDNKLWEKSPFFNFFFVWLTNSIHYPNYSPNLRPFLCFHNTQQTQPRTASYCGLSLVIRKRTRTNVSENLVTAAEAESFNVNTSQKFS